MKNMNMFYFKHMREFQYVNGVVLRFFNNNGLLKQSTILHLKNISFFSTAGQSLQQNENDSSDKFGTLQKSLEVYPRSSKFKKSTKIIKVNRKHVQDKNADVFGTLTEKEPLWFPDFKEESKEDNEQSDDSLMIRNLSKKYRSPESYLERMKCLVTEKKLKEALDLFVEMKRNHVKPERLHFTFMIGACGRFGYTEMAYKLFKQILDRGLRPTPATLTSLFNACGECPLPEYGLRKANLLREKIQLKNWQLNQINYHSMIKAFGKCGDIQTAFQIVDEMKTAEIKIDVTTYSLLLISCIADKEAGFTHAIEVWRKMKERNCLPNRYSYNLLLRAARDCDIGPEEVSCLLVEHWSSFGNRPYGFKTKHNVRQKEALQHLGAKPLITDAGPNTQFRIDSNESSIDSNGDSKNTPTSLLTKKCEKSLVENKYNTVPSILSLRPVQDTAVIDLKNIRSSSDRLSLIGGMKGVLIDMQEKKVLPNIKTFTLLLECLPPNTDAEEKILSLFESHKLSPDIGFFNILIKRRNFRFDYPAARDVLLLINKWSLSPDLITFGVLSMGCRSHQQAYTFLSDLKKLGFAPNTEIAGALLSCACVAADFIYIEDTLKLMDEYGIKPNERMLHRLESTLDTIRNTVIDMEHGKTVPNKYNREGFVDEYKKFFVFYERWLKKTSFAKEEHIWNQYRTEIVEKSNRIFLN